MAIKVIKEKSIEETLWQSCDKLRGSVEPAEYKHVVLGLIFLKFASDKFEVRRKELIEEGKEKLVYRNDYHGRQEAALSIFEWIETWYNTNRRHSAIGNMTIKEFENLTQLKNVA
jgi:type I restriction-modification system DNA methylase subunit